MVVRKVKKPEYNDKVNKPNNSVLFRFFVTTFTWFGRQRDRRRRKKGRRLNVGCSEAKVSLWLMAISVYGYHKCLDKCPTRNTLSTKNNWIAITLSRILIVRYISPLSTVIFYVRTSQYSSINTTITTTTPVRLSILGAITLSHLPWSLSCCNGSSFCSGSAWLAQHVRAQSWSPSEGWSWSYKLTNYVSVNWKIKTTLMTAEYN